MAIKWPDGDEDPCYEELDGAAVLEERALWLAVRGNDAVAKAELVSRYLGFVRSVALRVFRNTNAAYVDFRDLVQLGVVGLLEAMQSYEVDGSAGFRTYAGKRIRGAMLDGLEKISELHAQSMLRKRIRAERAQSLQARAREMVGSEPFMQMVEVALGLAVGHMIEGTAMFVASESAVPEESDAVPGELHSMLVSMSALVNQIDEPGRQIIRRHYFDGMRFAAIADLLGLSKSRVSQLHARALDELRERYRGKKGFSLEI